ncbi:MAG: hypothetical protein R3Y68_08300 [Rikenellaceae bacterium]
MKKLFYTLLISAMVVVATTSCNKNDSDYSNASGAVSQISDGDYTINFNYDSSGRVVNVSTNDGESYNFSYDGSTISSTISYSEPGYWANSLLEVELDSDGTITTATMEESDSEGDYYESIYTYTSDNGKVTSINADGRNCSVSWSGDDIKVLDDDVFSPSQYKNDYSIDLNMFLTNSEEISDLFGGEYFGFNKEIKGIHSEYLIDECAEEGETYEVIYETNSEGKITKASWDKYDNGEFNEIYVSYY